MRRTNIYLDDRQTEALDRRARAEGTSRAAIIRRVLDGWLARGDDDISGDLAAIETSFGALADLDVIDRSTEERSAHLERLWHLRP